MSRRDTFRAFMKRLDPKGDPSVVLRDGLYVEPASGPAKQILPSLELRPNGSHLVLGPIGSGKTTQLRVLEGILTEHTDVLPVFVDVGTVHDVEETRPGVLIVSAAAAIGERLPKTPGATAHRAEIERLAHGAPVPALAARFAKFASAVGPWESGVLSRSTPWVGKVAKARWALGSMLAEAAGGGERPAVVVLFDGLDRLHDLQSFESIVEQDLRALRDLGVGVVLAASQRLLYGASIEIRRHFDRTHRIVVGDPAFLRDVLRSRAGGELLPPPSADRVAEWSGGVLRDLIAIAQGAGEEAYSNGTDVIEVAHVDAAADRFGRALLLGVEEPARKTLERVLEGPSFSVASDADVQLLVEDRILDLGGRYVVHPTLVPLLAA